MKCSLCGEKAIGVFQGKAYCREHYRDAFEDFVFNFIEDKNLIPSSKVAVAVSGGKDSISALNVVMKYMKKKGLGKPIALSVDEGITNYRKKTLENVKRFCSENKIELKIISYKEAFGFSLDEFLKRFDVHPCSICGVLRRYLLNKYAKGFDVVVIGHNLDDEAQSVLMNLIRGEMSLLARLGYSSGLSSNKKFVRRVKPFYLVKEKEVLIYSIISGLSPPLERCPNAHLAFRNPVRDLINEYEKKEKGVKRNIIDFFLSIKEDLRELVRGFSLHECEICGEPTSKRICKSCLIRMSWERGEQIF